MTNYRDEDMDRFITGNYGQDQFKDEDDCEECESKEEDVICGDCGEHAECCSTCGTDCCGARAKF